jgi:hypothetical protein
VKNESRADAERDLRYLISAAVADVAEKARRERLLRHLESADKAHPLELASTALSELKRLLQRWTSNNEICDCQFESHRMGGQLE